MLERLKRLSLIKKCMKGLNSVIDGFCSLCISLVVGQIGLGFKKYEIGKPLSTIVVSKLRGDLHNTGFFIFLINYLMDNSIFISRNILNIICVSKLNIKSKEWAIYGLLY